MWFVSYSINDLEQNGFQLPDRVLPENARQDKLKLRIGFWGLHAEDKSDCIEIMGDIALNTMCSDGEGNTHRLFRESLRGRGNSRGVVFANGGHGGSIERSRPLISGQSIWARSIRNYPTPSPYSLAFDIYFNPTKAVQCQPLPRRLRAGRIVSVNRVVFDTSELFTPTYQFNDEYVLTEEANLILGCSQRERMASLDS